MGKADAKNGKWAVKEEAVKEVEKEEVCYSRCVLLQLSGHCRTTDVKTHSADNSPWKSGALYSLSVDKLPACKVPPARVRCTSAEQAKISKPNTLILKNIPFGYDRTQLCEELAAHGFGYAIDLLYLPVDIATNKNSGYAFVNVRSKEACREFIKTFQGVSAADVLPTFKSVKTCTVATADVQGRDANMARLATSANVKMWSTNEDWAPLFLDDYGRKIPMTEWAIRSSDYQRERCMSADTTPVLAPHLSPMLKPMSKDAPEFVPPMDAKEFSKDAPEFVPQNLEMIFSESASPSMRPEAHEFVPCGGYMDMEALPEAYEIAAC